MVTEGCYSQLKGRWRIFLKKCESNKDEMKIATLACMVLHNICIDNGDIISKKLDLTVDPTTNHRRDRAKIRDLLQMTSCEKIGDSCNQEKLIRDAVAEKFFLEKQTGEVC